MSTFDGYIREFDGLIRVDNFEQSDWRPFGCRPSLVYLLSHAHSDHMVGLDRFTGSIVYCSHLTKQIVRKVRTRRDRVNQTSDRTDGIQERTYKNLFHQNLTNADLLKPLALRQPHEIALPTPEPDLSCRITLIPANHCPGSVMFLIQMWNLSVLYTGDIRAEPWWVESLIKEPLLASYVIPLSEFSRTPQDPCSESSTSRISNPLTPLDNIYLDTSSLLSKIDVLTKDDAIEATIKMMTCYPEDTNFFINAWTWGYEELLEAIAARFATSIHVDHYKYDIYNQSHFRQHFPQLCRCITLDQTATRFHACGREYRCSQVNQSPAPVGLTQKRVVTINPWEITTPNWDEYRKDLDEKLRTARRESESRSKFNTDPWPNCLVT